MTPTTPPFGISGKATICLTCASEVWYYLIIPFGGIAQLVERLNGIQKVWGSTPDTYTIYSH